MSNSKKYRIGGTLYYKCKDIDDWREGKVFQRIQHYGVTYYVLEVGTGAPIWEEFLHLASQFRVREESPTKKEK